MPAIYIADGHHRSASASRVSAARRGKAPADGPQDYFLSVIFLHNQMKILDYNRVVTDLNGLSPEQFLPRMAEHFDLNASAEAVHPRGHGEFGMYLAGQWYA